MTFTVFIVVLVVIILFLFSMEFWSAHSRTAPLEDNKINSNLAKKLLAYKVVYPTCFSELDKTYLTYKFISSVSNDYFNKQHVSSILFNCTSNEVNVRYIKIDGTRVRIEIYSHEKAVWLYLHSFDFFNTVKSVLEDTDHHIERMKPLLLEQYNMLNQYDFFSVSLSKSLYSCEVIDGALSIKFKNNLNYVYQPVDDVVYSLNS